MAAKIYIDKLNLEQKSTTEDIQDHTMKKFQNVLSILDLTLLFLFHHTVHGLASLINTYRLIKNLMRCGRHGGMEQVGSNGKNYTDREWLTSRANKSPLRTI